jgi:hypothetical protein
VEKKNPQWILSCFWVAQPLNAAPPKSEYCRGAI